MIPSDTVFHILSLEGPDAYSRAGGIASRVTGLAETLAAADFETHLWFVGDPDLPPHDRIGRLHLHRWCQWLSRLSPKGVYADEEAKRHEYVSSLPPFLVDQILAPQFARSNSNAVILAEEWQTFHAVLHLDWLLRRQRLRARAQILWNANNVFGFETIDWDRLGRAATITTVSRYMRQRMWQQGVDARVIPNGIAASALALPDRHAVLELRRRMRDRMVLSKVARWDPDKRWLLAVDTAAELKRGGRRPLLVARGGLEAHGTEVLERARRQGLRVVERQQSGCGVDELVASVADLDDADVLSLRAPLSPDACRTLYRASNAVLVNSGHEPFGLVGLESMAVGAVTCVGGTGEDYALPGWNALALPSDDPTEFGRQYDQLASNPDEERALRRRAVAGAKRFLWTEVVRRHLLPQLGIASGATTATRMPVPPRRAAAAICETSDANLPLAAQASL